MGRPTFGHPQALRGCRSARLVLNVLLAALGLLAGLAVPSVAQAATAGRACIFNAPSGAIIAGHVGWAFRNGSGDNWIFGATEGSDNTTSWIETNGAWVHVLATFGQGLHSNKGIGYYTSYRCANVASSNPTLAYNQALTDARNGYDLRTNNCLTKSVDVLRAYGVSTLPTPTTLGISQFPNTYYGNLPGYGFDGYAQWLVTLSATLLDPVSKAWINTAPVHRQRPLRYQVYDSSNRVVGNSATTATVASGTDKYIATISLPGNLSTGLAFYVKLALDYTLFAQPAGFGVTGSTSGFSDTPVTVGDVNQDNAVNTTDYNLMMQCYSDLLPPQGPCSTQLKRASDLNDDGAVNQIDYNLYLRVVQNHGGS